MWCEQALHSYRECTLKHPHIMVPADIAIKRKITQYSASRVPDNGNTCELNIAISKQRSSLNSILDFLYNGSIINFAFVPLFKTDSRSRTPCHTIRGRHGLITKHPVHITAGTVFYSYEKN